MTDDVVRVNTEEEELLLQILGSIAEQGRQDELPQILAGLVFAVASIHDDPDQFVDNMLVGIEVTREQLKADGEMPGQS